MQTSVAWTIVNKEIVLIKKIPTAILSQCVSYYHRLLHVIDLGFECSTKRQRTILVAVIADQLSY